jgi:hypothetical protein
VPDLVGAARGIRTPDPVITNDVLYRLSYCGGPCNSRALRDGLKTRAHLISGTALIGKKKGGFCGMIRKSGRRFSETIMPKQ